MAATTDAARRPLLRGSRRDLPLSGASCFITPVVLCTDAAVMRAEPEGTPAPSASSEKVVERPPSGLSQGLLPAPAWTILALASLVVVATVLFLVARHWGASARRRGGAPGTIPPREPRGPSTP